MAETHRLTEKLGLGGLCVLAGSASGLETQSVDVVHLNRGGRFMVYK